MGLINTFGTHETIGGDSSNIGKMSVEDAETHPKRKKIGGFGNVFSTRSTGDPDRRKQRKQRKNRPGRKQRIKNE
jgi:hypothetical protein